MYKENNWHCAANADTAVKKNLCSYVKNLALQIFYVTL